MRIWTRPVLGNSLETTRFFVNRSMTSRVLLLGLPLLTLVLLLVFLATGRSIEALVNRAIARNAQLQAQAMSLSLEQILTETRNQLLILAAGSMDPKDMVRRLQFRVRAEGLRYREVAFMGTDPSQRYLLLSYGGEIISIGTDAHTPEFVGMRARETQELLKSCGLNYVCTFEKKKPVFHKI